MSFTKKIVSAYAKSLFQNIKTTQPKEEKRVIYKISLITSKEKAEEKKCNPDLFSVNYELNMLRSLVLNSKKLTEFFKNPTYSEKQKLELFHTVFPSLSLPVKSFLNILTERSHLYLIPEIAEEYKRLFFEFKNYITIKLVTPSILEESYGSLLFNTLKKLTNSNRIFLNVSYDPKLLGGLMIEYKSTLIDLSILKEFSLFFNEV